MSKETVKGFQDILGKDALRRRSVVEALEKQFQLYGFEPVETPIVEHEEFVVGENPHDDAVRDVFKLQDRGERKLALRYEFTFQLKRIAVGQKLPFRRYQIGNVFRDEPLRKGRMRQFVQCDVDVIGSNARDEAELLSLAQQVFSKLNIPITIYVNNRKLLNEILMTERVEEKDRQQVIRELDKLDKLSKKEVADNLKKIGYERVLKAFDVDEASFKKYTYYKEIEELRRLCKEYSVDVVFRPFLARGFSYYNGSVFEIWSDKLGVSLCGGGSYLVAKTQSTGISFGLEPLMLLADLEVEGTRVQVVSLGKDKEAVSLAHALRNSGISTLALFDKTVGKAMEYANAKGIPFVLLVGEKEVEAGKFTLKNMKSGKEEKLGEKKLIESLLMNER